MNKRKLALERRIAFLEKKIKNEDSQRVLDAIGEVYLLQADVINGLELAFDNLKKMADISASELGNRELSEECLDLAEGIDNVLDDLNDMEITD